MQCRHCNTGEAEIQEHIGKCSYFAKERNTLNLDEGKDKLIFWRKVIFVSTINKKVGTPVVTTYTYFYYPFKNPE